MDLAAELIARMARDQEPRIAAQAGEDEAAWRRVQAMDAANRAWLKGILYPSPSTRR